MTSCEVATHEVVNLIFWHMWWICLSVWLNIHIWIWHLTNLSHGVHISQCHVWGILGHYQTKPNQNIYGRAKRNLPGKPRACRGCQNPLSVSDFSRAEPLSLPSHGLPQDPKIKGLSRFSSWYWKYLTHTALDALINVNPIEWLVPYPMS